MRLAQNGTFACTQRLGAALTLFDHSSLTRKKGKAMTVSKMDTALSSRRSAVSFVSKCTLAQAHTPHKTKIEHSHAWKPSLHGNAYRTHMARNKRAELVGTNYTSLPSLHSALRRERFDRNRSQTALKQNHKHVSDVEVAERSPFAFKIEKSSCYDHTGGSWFFLLIRRTKMHKK